MIGFSDKLYFFVSYPELNLKGWQTVKSNKNWCYGETSSRCKSKASNKMIVHQEMISLKPLELNHGRNVDDVVEILKYDSSFNSNQSNEVQSSSSESEDEATLKEQGSWCEQDIKAYLLSRFTSKELKRLDKWQRKWQRNELNGKLIGRDIEFIFQGEILAPLLMVPQGNETRTAYYIKDLVVNAFFELLKKRSEKFLNAYINHYSFDSQIATQLIKGRNTEQEILAHFKAKKLWGVHKMFLPMCLSEHWVLFYVDTKEKKISWLDPIASSRIVSNNVEKQIILQWFTNFLLPEFGYNDAKEWPFIVRTDIPEQKSSVDCGVFVMKYGDCLTHGDCFPFKQEDINNFRRRIFLDIYCGRLHRKTKKD
ncbi:zinc finger BED domain-containing protein RICESLEEPER 1-like [Gossypium australe]|uniref:Zinc finger BED domain-containing protein RICESLEEPER 1-like n=1 Tax=Gossypium australe TaxID=47621 RepID=A0A5B6WW24_9ROSI|nr:zinc finger BED domain-containing protein RICESLEEPER 1-like [Gossypium australe]